MYYSRQLMKFETFCELFVGRKIHVYFMFFFNQVLYAKDLDQRSITFEKAITMGEDYQMKSKVLYSFVSCDFTIFFNAFVWINRSV